MLGMCVLKHEQRSMEIVHTNQILWIYFKVRSKMFPTNGSPALCKHSVAYIKQSYI